MHDCINGFINRVFYHDPLTMLESLVLLIYIYTYTYTHILNYCLQQGCLLLPQFLCVLSTFWLLGLYYVVRWSEMVNIPILPGFLLWSFSLFISLFAAQAGASRVIAIEASQKMATVATQVKFFRLLVFKMTYLFNCIAF